MEAGRTLRKQFHAKTQRSQRTHSDRVVWTAAGEGYTKNSQAIYMADPAIARPYETVIKNDAFKNVYYPQQVAWDVHDVPPQLDGRFVFYHTCTADLGNKQLFATEGDKEFGGGFYTTCGDIAKPYQLIAGEWFETKQQRHDWHVVAFTLKSDALINVLLENAGDAKDRLKVPLTFYLTHSTGYPSGQKNPTDKDLADINEINLLGRVFILPSNKDQSVKFFDGEDRNWTQFTAGKCGGGPYYLIIGPQQPEYMLDYRQYAWTTGWGIFYINCAMRFYAYRNYRLFGKDAGQYRAPLPDKMWPANHPKVKPDGSKF